MMMTMVMTVLVGKFCFQATFFLFLDRNRVLTVLDAAYCCTCCRRNV